MSAPQGHIHEINTPTGHPAGSGPNGGGFSERLARVEEKLDSIKEHGATKNDISKVKIWFLVGVVSAIGLAIPTAVGVAFAVARLFSGP